MEGYQLKITLKHTKPPIWRRIWIPKNMSFFHLHYAIQSMFDWDGSHLYDFNIPSLNLEFIPDEIAEDDDLLFSYNHQRKSINSALSDYLYDSLRIHYTYDYGANWEVLILVEKTIDNPNSTIQLLKWKGDNISEYDYKIEKFDEESVIDAFNGISSLELYYPLSDEKNKQLYSTIDSFFEELDKKELSDMSVLIAKTPFSKKVLSINKQTDCIHIYLFENESEFMRGIENAPALSTNTFMNSVSIIHLNTDDLTDDDWESENINFVKILRMGSLPYDPNDEDAQTIINDLNNFTSILNASSYSELPEYNDGHVLLGEWDSKNQLKISYPIKYMVQEIITIHISKADVEKLTQKQSKNSIIYIDLISDINPKNINDSHIPLYLTFETFSSQEKELLDESAYLSYKNVCHCVISILCDYIEANGCMQTIVVNNDNMAQILCGVCEDLGIEIRIGDFISKAQEEILYNIQEDYEFLNTLSEMNEEEFCHMLENMDEDELSEFYETIKDYLFKYGIDEEDDDELDLPHKRKFFDA